MGQGHHHQRHISGYRDAASPADRGRRHRTNIQPAALCPPGALLCVAPGPRPVGLQSLRHNRPGSLSCSHGPAHGLGVHLGAPRHHDPDAARADQHDDLIQRGNSHLCNRRNQEHHAERGRRASAHGIAHSRKCQPRQPRERCIKVERRRCNHLQHRCQHHQRQQRPHQLPDGAHQCRPGASDRQELQEQRPADPNLCNPDSRQSVRGPPGPPGAWPRGYCAAARRLAPRGSAGESEKGQGRRRQGHKCAGRQDPPRAAPECVVSCACRLLVSLLGPRDRKLNDEGSQHHFPGDRARNLPHLADAHHR
eukprot:comp13267_c0_seq1/m.18150 comp13267_c0_seq1/g.18150  ORF comp13267_c0_seq1/g.18150 comp13267_c0_seq1/m.18150 type:complete len:308 (+) comp13267_c0_seq1:1774-2697(+)